MKKFGFKKENIFPKKGGEQRANAILQKLRRKMYQRIKEAKYSPFEYEKTEQDREIISFFHNLILKRMESLGLQVEDKKKIQCIDQIHFIDEDKDFLGFYYDKNRNIEVNGNLSVFKKYMTLVHEMLHLFSHPKVKEQEEEKLVFRTGYSYQKYFYEFNEFITEKIAREILIENADLFSKKIHKKENEVIKQIQQESSYQRYIEIFEIMMQVASENLNIPQDEIWRNIQRGYFSGDMMHLRIFEKVYGKGFLRFIAQFPEYVEKQNVTYDDLKNFLRGEKSSLRLENLMGE